MFLYKLSQTEKRSNKRMIFVGHRATLPNNMHHVYALLTIKKSKVETIFFCYVLDVLLNYFSYRGTKMRGTGPIISNPVIIMINSYQRPKTKLKDLELPLVASTGRQYFFYFIVITILYFQDSYMTSMCDWISWIIILFNETRRPSTERATIERRTSYWIHYFLSNWFEGRKMM